jgi:SAM-dependent methyltransferase
MQNSIIVRQVKRILQHPIWNPTCFYDDLSKRTRIHHYHKTLHTFLNEIGNDHRSEILDLGCGNRKLPGKTLGLDIMAYPMVSVVGDGQFLPFKTNTFSGVVLQEVLEHISDLQQVLKEVYRVLKPDGKVYIEVPLVYPIHTTADFWRFTPMGLDFLCRHYFQPHSKGLVMGGGSAVGVVVRTYFAIALSRGQKGFGYNLGWLVGGLLTWWFKYLDDWLRLRDAPLMEKLAAGHYWIGEKPNAN